MQFTTQQLIGGPRYSTKTRIGNWSEDEARFDVASQDYQQKKSKGDLLHLKKQRQKLLESQAVPHTFSHDGLLRFGDNVQISIGIDGRRRSLASNLFLPTKPGHSRVTATETVESQARNVFVLLRPSTSGSRASTPIALDDIIRYGDRLYIATNPSLTADPATKTVGLQSLLTSQRVSNVIGAGRKGRQEATLCARRCADAEWVVTAADGDRLATDGTPVRSGDPVCITHAMTNEALASVPGDTYPTDFGLELDVHVNSYRKAGRHASMDVATDLPRIAALEPNHWAFVTSADPSAAVDSRGFRPLTSATLVERARSLISSHSGPHGLRSLSLALLALDQRGTGIVPSDATQWALFDHGVIQSDEEFALMLGQFGAAAPGMSSGGAIAVRSLLTALRGGGEGALPASREEIVRAAFSHIQTKTAASKPAAAKAVVTFADMLRLSSVGRADPRVSVGSLTSVEAASEFARQWPSIGRPTDEVTFPLFAGYYADVSAMESDDYAFEELVANSWHIPGRGSWRGKLGKRVIVTLHKGATHDVVIADGEDIPDEDFERLVSALKVQGITGVARIKVVGLVEPE